MQLKHFGLGEVSVRCIGQGGGCLSSWSSILRPGGIIPDGNKARDGQRHFLDHATAWSIIIVFCEDGISCYIFIISNKFIEMSNVLVVGATRGLGFELVKQYAEQGVNVTGTARSSPPEGAPSSIKWISKVDVAKEDAGSVIADGLKGQKQDIVIISAGVFIKESFDEPDFDAEVQMYKTSAIGPIFITRKLQKAGLLKKGTKLILVSSEAGSITLRHPTEGGGMYGHHASKAALNMVGKLLSFDLRDAGVAVGLVHPAFMRTEMTRGVGFDKFWDEGGAVTPDESAKSLIEWIATFDIGKTGEYWAPRGPGYVSRRDFASRIDPSNTFLVTLAPQSPCWVPRTSFLPHYTSHGEPWRCAKVW